MSILHPSSSDWRFECAIRTLERRVLLMKFSKIVIVFFPLFNFSIIPSFPSAFPGRYACSLSLALFIFLSVTLTPGRIYTRSGHARRSAESGAVRCDFRTHSASILFVFIFFGICSPKTRRTLLLPLLLPAMSPRPRSTHPQVAKAG